MDTLAKIGKQFSDLFASMTPQARIMAGLMLGVVVVSLGWIMGNQQTKNTTYIMGSLSPDEIRNAEGAFGSAMLSDYEIVGTRIAVPSSQKALYLKALQDGNAIPIQYGDAMKESLQPGIFDPPSLSKAKQKFASEQEFAKVLEMMPQIDFAAVRFDEKTQGFARDTIKTCSIKVRKASNQPIENAVLRSIADAAMSELAGLKRENISVLDLGSANLYRPSKNPDSFEDNPVLRATEAWEQKYRDQAMELLTEYGDVKLGISVLLDPKLLEESEKLQYDPTAIATESTLNRVDSESAKASRGGRPGVAPNALNTQQSIASSAPDQTSKVKETAESTRSIVGSTAVVTKMAGLVPTTVTISVGVPESHFRKIHAFNWSLANPTEDPTAMPVPTANELLAIKDDVVTEIRSRLSIIPVGVRSGEDTDPYISVTSYTDLPLPEIVGPTLAENSMAWLSESWTTLAMLALVLLSLGMMFSWVRSQQGDPENERKFAEGFGLQVPEHMGDELELSSSGAEEKPEGKQAPTFEVSGAEMKEDLSTLIKSNPDAAANLLKAWIGEAA